MDTLARQVVFGTLISGLHRLRPRNAAFLPGLASSFVALFLAVIPDTANAAVSIRLDLSAQRAYLLDENRVLAQSPISSGRSGHRTPSGNFKVLEKDPDHRSSEYGRIVSSSGKVLVRDADAGTPVPKGAKFVAAPMHYFLRFRGAIGMHAGNVPNHPASHGCVRLPADKAPLFYRAAELGTPVIVTGQAP